MNVTIGSIFSGVGGLDLAVESVTGGSVVWQAETDPYAAAVLARRWPSVPNLGDVRFLAAPPAVDVLCGGFPCQDISSAGKRKGIEGERSGLWTEFARLIRQLGPGFVFVETSHPSGVAGSTLFSGTWPRSGSMRNGRVSPRPPLEPHIDGIGCSFWPTPTATPYGSSQNGVNSTRPSGGTASLWTLASTWPTPMSSDARDTARGTTSTGVMHAGVTLTDAIRAWCSRHVQMMAKAGPGGSGTAVLHPEFVEALMGLPIRWTHVGDADAYDALVMGLLPGKQRRLF